MSKDAYTSIVTESGSVYVVRESAGTFFLSGRNIANPESRALPPKEIAVDRPTPWPPIVGQGVFLGASRPTTEGFRHTKGKFTSNVKEVRHWDAPDTAINALLESL